MSRKNPEGDFTLRGVPPTDHFPSVGRALRVLRYVSRSPLSGIRIASIPAGTELTLSAAYHIVRTLVHEGYLHRVRPGIVAASPTITHRYRELLAAYSEPEPVRAALRKAAFDTSQRLYLARLVGMRLTITAAAPLQFPSEPPELIPGFDEAAHATGFGHAFLAALEPPERRAYLARGGMQTYTPVTATTPPALEAGLLANPTGVFAEVGQFRAGVATLGTLAVPHVKAKERVILGCSMSAEEFSSQAAHMGGLLRTCATNLREIYNTLPQPDIPIQEQM